MMIKALAGGGGRGMRAVSRVEEIDEAYKRCQSEARASFGNGDVYVEQLMPRARHIEVQIIGDGSGNVSHLWERECSIQRRNQKIVEIAPSPGLEPAIRDRLTAAAVRMAKEVRYDNLGTFEFLVNADASASDEAGFAFIEANPRLQVEHTVTEEVTGIDLVKLQIQLAPVARSRNSGCSKRTFPNRAGSRCRCASTWNRCAPMAARSLAAERSPRSRRRRDRACAPIRSPTPDTRRARISTRCSPS